MESPGKAVCVLCDREIQATDRVARAPEVGIPVHIACYEREAGISEPLRFHTAEGGTETA